MTALVGIVNVTPDSFSDGGEDYLARIEEMIRLGVAVIDIGAESTRPGAKPIDVVEELTRLKFIFAGLPKWRDSGAIFSLDTRHAGTAKRGIAAGFDWINDVSGFADTEIASVIAVNPTSRYVLTHSLTVPSDPTITLPDGCDVIAELLAFAEAKLAELQHHGVRRDQIIFDPGLGFGKTAQQNWEIVRRAGELRASGLPLLFGHSRKRFLGETKCPSDRDAATLAISLALADGGIDYLRVHAVADHQHALKAWEAARVRP